MKEHNECKILDTEDECSSSDEDSDSDCENEIVMSYPAPIEHGTPGSYYDSDSDGD